MHRNSIFAVGAAEDLAVLSQVREKPAIRDLQLDVDVQEMLR
jgi:hypothetical protein